MHDRASSAEGNPPIASAEPAHPNRDGSQSVALPDTFRLGIDLSVAPLVVLHSGRVVHINPAAAKLIGRLSALRVENGTLTTRRRPEADALARLVASVDRPGRSERRNPILALRDREGIPNIMLAVQTLDIPKTGQLVIVRLSDLRRRSLPMSQSLSRSLGLTATEARVMAQMLADKGINGAAEALGLGRETVRSHLYSAMAKLGVKSRAQMLVLLHAAMSVGDADEGPDA